MTFGNIGRIEKYQRPRTEQRQLAATMLQQSEAFICGRPTTYIPKLSAMAACATHQIELRAQAWNQNPVTRIRLVFELMSGGQMALHLKRIYEPKDDKDGTRILVDRLWPRSPSRCARTSRSSSSRAIARSVAAGRSISGERIWTRKQRPIASCGLDDLTRSAVPSELPWVTSAISAFAHRSRTEGAKDF